MPDALSRVTVLDLPLVCSSFAQAAEALLAAARQREGGGAFFCNVHMSVEAREHPALRRALGRCRWIMPDGRPLSLAMRLLGHRASEQVAGPHMTEHLLARAEDENLRVFLYGGTEEQLVGLQRVIALRHPRLVVAGAISPPFRPLGQEDLSLEAEHLAQIEASGAQLCFVGLGCPKQELWIDRHRHDTGALLLGVGAAFPMIAGTLPRAPGWLVAICGEWLYRLLQEPRRLWPRYAKTNPRFLNLLLRQLWSRA